MTFKTTIVSGAALLVATIAGPAAAEPGSHYDWRSGNSYHWNTDSTGNTSVRGSNLRTGAHWNTNIRPNGDMRGTDSNYNSWSYDRSSGSYWNTDGTTCYGKGAYRTCN